MAERACATVDVESVERNIELLSSSRMTGTGAVVNSPGSCAWAACATSFATLLMPCLLATAARVSTNAAAQSEIDEACIVGADIKHRKRVASLSESSVLGSTAWTFIRAISTHDIRTGNSHKVYRALHPPQRTAQD
jgi:hypothetical protein